MALISFKPAFGDKGSFTGPNKGTFTSTFVGISNNKFDTVLSIAADPKVYKVGTRFRPYAANAVVTQVDPQRRDEIGNFKVWDIAVTASTEEEVLVKNPLAEPAKISLSSDQYEMTTRKTAKGDWIRTTAGSIIPVQKEDSRYVLDVVKNVRSIPAYILNMNNTKNSGAVVVKGLVFNKGKLMVKGIRGEEATAELNGQTINYVVMSFQLHYRREGWTVKYPNVDFEEILFSWRAAIRDEYGNPRRVGGKLLYELLQKARRPILDLDGTPVKEPWPLDRQGRALPNKNGIPQGQIIELEADVYTESNFNALPLN